MARQVRARGIALSFSGVARKESPDLAAIESPITGPLADRSADEMVDPRLQTIRERAIAGQRLSLEDGDVLYESKDVWSVCEIADAVRRRLHGSVAYYNVNRHLNYSNICALSCTFCEFHRKRDQSGAYERSIDEIREEARSARDAGATEMHIVGGLHPFLPFEYYIDLVRAIREESPGLHVKAFTAVEIVHLAKIAKVFRRDDREAGIRWVLERLKSAGLGSLPGGGAEVFDDRVHDEAFKGKIRSDVWLDVHRVAHELGLNTNATILYGHIDARRERLVHMDMLRCAQDEALARLGYAADESGAITLTREEVDPPTPEMNNQGGYFQAIIPLPFFPDGSELEHLPGPDGLENLRSLAVARLMLDNFPHVKSFWIMQTLPMAQLMLSGGADDIDGTVVWYDITKVGGTSTHQETTVWDLQRSIREAGFEPIERDTLYRRVERDGAQWRVATT
jgi:aminodeoxyfutalosine synthase